MTPAAPSGSQQQRYPFVLQSERGLVLQLMVANTKPGPRKVQTEVCFSIIKGSEIKARLPGKLEEGRSAKRIILLVDHHTASMVVVVTIKSRVFQD